MVARVNAHDPRVGRTRELLQSAFTDLAHEKSFDAITVREIAERATVNRATFYAHFADKYALLDATIGALFTRMLLGRLPTGARMTEATVRALVVAVCDYHRDLNGRCGCAYRSLESSLGPRIIAHLHDVVRACLGRTETLQARAPEALEIAATVISWSVYGAALRWHTSESRRGAEAFAEVVAPVIMGGITTLGATAPSPPRTDR